MSVPYPKTTGSPRFSTSNVVRKGGSSSVEEREKEKRERTNYVVGAVVGLFVLILAIGIGWGLYDRNRRSKVLTTPLSALVSPVPPTTPSTTLNAPTYTYLAQTPPTQYGVWADDYYPCLDQSLEPCFQGYPLCVMSEAQAMLYCASQPSCLGYVKPLNPSDPWYGTQPCTCSNPTSYPSTCAGSTSNASLCSNASDTPCFPNDAVQLVGVAPNSSTATSGVNGIFYQKSVVSS